MSPLDEALANLAHVHRRRVLLVLLDHDRRSAEGLSVPEDVHPEAAESESVWVQMQHTHLPRLEDVGYIEWNRDDQRVAKGPKFDETEPLLELLVSNADELPGDLR